MQPECLHREEKWYKNGIDLGTSMPNCSNKEQFTVEVIHDEGAGLGMLNFGKVRKYMGSTNERQRLFQQICLHRFIVASAFHVWTEECSLFLSTWGHFSHRKSFVLFLGRMRVIRESFSHLLFVKYLQLKKIHMAGWQFGAGMF